MLRITLSVLTVCLLTPLAACGGSSSETPFPLEPDLSRLDGGPSSGSRYVVYKGEKQKPGPSDEQGAPDEGDKDVPPPEKPAK